MAFWPGPGWPPWDALVAAGFRCATDRRNAAPPIVLFEVDSARRDGTAGSCTVVVGEVLARCLAPAPDVADARMWAWTGPVPVLIGHASDDAAAANEFDGMPCVEVRLPYSYTI